MVWEYAENIVQLLADLAALVMCLFCYISNKRRAWLYGILFFLSGLLSCYYWTTYLIIMGDWPNVSDLMTYSGWNIAFLVLFILLMHMKSPEERRYFHPLMLLPVPLNIWQLTVYLPYGVLWNNLYQVSINTLTAVFSLQGLLWYRKNRAAGAGKPYVSFAALLIVLFEFSMWTSSCFYPPVGDLYYPFSMLCSISYLILVWAIRRSFSGEGMDAVTSFDRKYQNLLKAASLAIVLAFSVGGVLLGVWMRNVMRRDMDPSAASGLFDIIPIVLFIISLILVAFVVAVIFVVYFGQRAAENNKLREARQVAERSSAAKSEFLATMSHEIRTPINAVMGMNEIVLRESSQARDRLPESSDEVRGIFADICGYAGVIDSAGKNLLSIINDILDISRIEAGKLEIREDSYLLSSVLNDVCNLIGFRAHSRGLAFHVDVEKRLPDNLFGDALRIRQVVLNLLNNAVKYTERGSVTLSVYTDPDAVPADGQTMNLIVSVRDTGVGIRPEDQDKIFNKFERIGLTESGGVEGTGLGLMISRNLLDMMGGTIRVDSVFGEGSVFTVTIPQKVVSAAPIGDFMERFERASAGSDAPGEFFRAPSARVLAVDDTRMNLTVIEGLLKKTEIQIDAASGGKDALRLALSVPYDLILMDQRMPDMDGTETMRLIRAQENGVNRTTPVICLTADAIAGAKERYLAEGFTDYLSKPIDSQALRKKLIAYLPPEKVVLLPPEEERDRSAGAEDAFSALGPEIDAAQGMMHCRQDEALYRSLLAEFAKDAPERLERLEAAFTAGAWKEYGLLVHSLKSVSGTIGAVRLSDAAAAMEISAKQEDAAALRSGHVPLLALYRQAAGTVRAFCGDPEDSLPDDDGVLEFMPEE